MAGMKLKSGKYKIKIFKEDSKVFEKEIEIKKYETNFVDLNF